MPWNSTHYVWAGLILLCCNLVHFTANRKLHDRYSRIFICIALTDLMLCLANITLNTFLGKEYAFCNIICTLLATMIYLSELLIPFEIFAFICSYMDLDYTSYKKRLQVSSYICLTGILIIIINIFTGFIAYIGTDHFLHVTFGYHVMVRFFTLLYIIDLIYIMINYRHIKKTTLITIIEICLMLFIGLIVQQYLQINLFFGFMASLGVSIIHLVLVNPGLYYDSSASAYSESYFFKLAKEQIEAGKPFHVFIVELAQLERITKAYKRGTRTALIVKISKDFKHLMHDCHLFRLSQGQFAVYAKSSEVLDCAIKITFDYFSKYIVLKQPDNVEKIFCPVKIIKIGDSRNFKTLETLTAYTDFLLKKCNFIGKTIMLEGTEELFSEFNYEREVEKFLETAIKKDLFEVWYQPVYSLQDEKYITLEALSRLRHPSLGMIYPDVFIRLATSNGQLTRIMPLQLRKICRFIEENPDLMKKLKNIKMNLSPTELIEPEYCEKLISIIKEYNFPSSMFEFEITEDVATEYSTAIGTCINQLEKAGISICLDDFGSGYANISTILRLPFSVIKMDRSLLLDICTNSNAAYMYQQTVSVLKNVGYKIVAEGVESEDELRLMRKWGVDMIQGYYFSKPLPAQDIVKLLN